MKKLKLVILSMAVLAALICGLAPAVAQADDKQTVSDLERKLAVTTNPDEAMKYWDDGDDVVLFDVMQPREFAGHKAIHDDLANFAGNKDVKVDFLEFAGHQRRKARPSPQRAAPYWQGCRRETIRRDLPADRCLAQDKRPVETHS